MRRGNLEYIQTFDTNPAPIDLPPRGMLALNERANQRPELRPTPSTSFELYEDPSGARIVFGAARQQRRLHSGLRGDPEAAGYKAGNPL
jgi:hypothetical protein